MNELLSQLIEQERIAPADAHLALHLVALDRKPSMELAALVALTSAGIRHGHVCLPLGSGFLQEQEEITVEPEVLLRSSIVGRPGDREKPLILDGDRLYLARYHAWEREVIGAIRRRLDAPAPAIDVPRLKADFARLFSSASADIDWQQVAAALALTRSFCVISGGPGTGKTWTVARILDLLLAQPESERLRIGLAAPTGKAAARMTESIGQADPRLLGRVSPATTMHRLLGMRPGRVRPRHGPDHPLPLDLLIVDEMSMVDLPMMARLLAALPERARLILLGDHRQLASVEAGQVMADLCGEADNRWSRERAREIRELTGQRLPMAEHPPRIADHLVELRQSRRFSSDSGIGRLAGAVNRGDGEATFEALQSDPDEVQWQRCPGDGLKRRIMGNLVPVAREMRELSDPRQALARLERVRVLCALRGGPQGTKNINRLVESALGVEGRHLYHGQPVMVTVNDHVQQLFNGDVGLVLEDDRGRLRVFFPDGQGGIRAILPGRLPAHETVHAMTIHKSQGSEFDEVILVLPEEESPVVTRELLYTGITRARNRVILCASEAAVKKAVSRRMERVSGLRDALWGGTDR